MRASADNPLYVHRADAPAHRRTEWSDGSAWHPIYSGDTGWVQLSTGSQWTGTVEACRRGSTVMMRGNASISGSGDLQNLCTLPVGMRPTRLQRFPPGIRSSGLISAVWQVNTNGTVAFYRGAASSAAMPVDSIRFEID